MCSLPKSPYPIPKPQQDHRGSGGSGQHLPWSHRDSGRAQLGPRDSNSAAQGPAHFMMRRDRPEVRDDMGNWPPSP